MIKSVFSLLVNMCVIVFVSAAAADTNIVQVTSNSYKDSLPQIKDNYLVWQTLMDGSWEIFLYDISIESTTQITDNDYDDISVQTDGTHIVWQGFRDGEWDIFIWNGEQTQAISGSGAQDYEPRIANGRVVWTSERIGVTGPIGPAEIVLYDTGSQMLTTLSATVDPENTLNDTSPKINEDVVIWVQTNEQGDLTSYMYDLSSGAITPDPRYAVRDNPRRDGDLRVSSRLSGPDREIFLYNNDSRNDHQITRNSFQDRNPSISGNRVVWMANGEIFFTEFKFLGLMRPKNGASLPKTAGATFAWESIGYEGFRIEFSKAPDFAGEDTLTFPLRAGSWLSDTSFAPSAWEWWFIRILGRRSDNLYWRVKGEDPAGNESLSKTFSFSIEERSRPRRRVRR